MTKWTDFTVDERKAMIQTVSETKQIDEPSAEKGLVGNGCSLCYVSHKY